MRGQNKWSEDYKVRHIGFDNPTRAHCAILIPKATKFGPTSSDSLSSSSNSAMSNPLIDSPTEYKVSN